MIKPLSDLPFPGSATFGLLRTAKVLCSRAPERAILLVFQSESDLKARKTMFGAVLILTLVFVTVAPPFAVVATAKARTRRR